VRNGRGDVPWSVDIGGGYSAVVMTPFMHLLVEASNRGVGSSTDLVVLGRRELVEYRSRALIVRHEQLVDGP
jgi:hypothetical protein